MRRLTVGESSRGRSTQGGVYPSVRIHVPQKTEIPAVSAPKTERPREETHAAPREEPRRHTLPPRRRQPQKLRFPLQLNELSPDKPLLRLGSRDIFAEDIMLVLLIIMLSQDDADPELIISLIYILLAG